MLNHMADAILKTSSSICQTHSDCCLAQENEQKLHAQPHGRCHLENLLFNLPNTHRLLPDAILKKSSSIHQTHTDCCLTLSWKSCLQSTKHCCLMLSWKSRLQSAKHCCLTASWKSCFQFTKHTDYCLTQQNEQKLLAQL